jgi:hypothetical protein
VPEEQLHGVRQALECGPLERCSVEGAGDSVHVCALLDEVFARLGSATYRGPVQRRDAVFVVVSWLCTTRIDQGSDAFNLS